MTSASKLTSSVSAYVKITPSGITANLVTYGTSMITRGHEQDLILDPGTYSVDLDGNLFNASVSIETLWECCFYSSLLSNRTGSISTTVASMACQISRTCLESICPSMILESILSTRHACPIERVSDVSFSLSPLIGCACMNRQWHIAVAVCKPERLTPVIGDDSV